MRDWKQFWLVLSCFTAFQAVYMYLLWVLFDSLQTCFLSPLAVVIILLLNYWQKVKQCSIHRFAFSILIYQSESRSPTPTNHVVSSRIPAWRLLMWSKYVPVCVVMKTKKRAVIDTSSIYVRGEENLGEWKPRGISLLDEHQSHLDKLERIQEVRAVSHSRLLRFRACASLSDV